jgi:hypothetical protein
LDRLLSAWFYRGHSPNNDFFQVRPEFKEIREGKRPQVTFAEYLEMHEYQNIVTRMLGADSFPYRNVTVTDKVIYALVVVVVVVWLFNSKYLMLLCDRFLVEQLKP